MGERVDDHPLNHVDKWICPKCRWFDGESYCLKSEVFNYDEGNCLGVSRCSGYVEGEGK